MPSLKDIRRRITSVQKTQQITSAMRMVAAAKLRRATDAIVAARPYADRMRDTLAEVAAAGGDAAEHPLLEAREAVQHVDVAVLVSDRGLCGAFNANVLKAAESLVAQREKQGQQVTVHPIGRKANDFFKRRRARQIGRVVTGIGRVDYDHATDVASHFSERFTSGEADEVVLVYSEFVSTMTQAPRVVPLLPFATGGGADAAESKERLPYSIEPSPEKLLQALVPKALEVQVFRALLENQAGEHAARMTAMESATRNTEELIEKLTLQYNRVRQAAITRELVEIVSGAEAL